MLFILALSSPAKRQRVRNNRAREKEYENQFPISRRSAQTVRTPRVYVRRCICAHRPERKIAKVDRCLPRSSLFLPFSGVARLAVYALGSYRYYARALLRRRTRTHVLPRHEPTIVRRASWLHLIYVRFNAYLPAPGASHPPRSLYLLLLLFQSLTPPPPFVSWSLRRLHTCAYARGTQSFEGRNYDQLKVRFRLR